MTYLDQLAIALETFAEKLDGIGTGELTQLSCSEANALGHLIAVYRSDESEAIEVLLKHIGSDSEEAEELADHLEEHPTLAGHIRATYGEGARMNRLLAEAEEIAHENQQERAQAEHDRQIQQED